MPVKLFPFMHSAVQQMPFQEVPELSLSFCDPPGQQPAGSGNYNSPYQVTAKPTAKMGDTYTVTFSD